MSGIWGIISKKGKDVSEIGLQMDEAMRKYRIDHFEHISCHNAYFSCGHQYITPESHFDKSPIFDESTGILFAADIFLYNRPAIIEQLKRTDTQTDFTHVGDAELAFMAYLESGDNFVELIRGYFAIAIYHSKENELRLFSDHLNRRYLAYSITDDMICFGSVYTPIFTALGGRPELCEECILDLYSDSSPLSFRVPSLTVYSGIYHVNCAECVKIDCASGTLKRHTFYSLKGRVKTLKLKSDEEYKQVFLKTYRECVEMLLRSDKETAIELSGGLDSASTAAFAAMALAKQGKKLYSYTSVPSSDYPYSNTTQFIENERFTVEPQVQRYPNIEPVFWSPESTCAFDNVDKFTEMFECPVKPIINLPYLYHFPTDAYDKQCRLMFEGANGNSSISYGSIFWYATYYLNRFRPIPAFREITQYCKRNNIARKKFLSVLLQGYWDRITSRFKFKFDSLLDDNLIRKYKIGKLARHTFLARGTDFFQNRIERTNYTYNPPMLAHMSFYQTYNSLLTGVLDVDATMTVEMIEFCLSLPIKVFVKNGRERRSIRDYMEDMLPKCVTSEYFGRGRQTVDCEFRVTRDWTKFSDEVLTRLSSDRLLKYLSKEKMTELLKKIGPEGDNGIHGRKTINDCITLFALDVFLEQYDK